MSHYYVNRQCEDEVYEGQSNQHAQSGTSMIPYGSSGDNIYGPNTYAAPPPVYGYGVRPHQPTQQQHYYQLPPPPLYPQQMQNMDGQQMQQCGAYSDSQQYTSAYGPAHAASYAGPSRRNSLTVVPVTQDPAQAPLAVSWFAVRDEHGAPTPAMFPIVPNHDTGVINISHVSSSPSPIICSK
jgi:hypothetical protein